MKRMTMLNKMMAMGLALALTVSSPVVAYADGESNDVIVENSVENNSSSDSSVTGGAGENTNDSAVEDASKSDDAAPAENSDGAGASVNSNEEELNKEPTIPVQDVVDEVIGEGDDDSKDSESGDQKEADAEGDVESEDETDIDDEDEDADADESDVEDQEEKVIEYSYKSNNDGTHTKSWTDEDGESHEEIEECQYDEDGVCTICGYKEETEEFEIEYTYTSNNDGTHIKSWVDEDGEYHEETEDCEYDENGICKKCGYEQEIELTDANGLVKITAKKSVLAGAVRVTAEEITFESNEDEYDKMAEALEEETDEETSVVHFVAYDINLYNENGDIVEPTGEVKVEFTSPNVEGLDDEEASTEVYHYDDDADSVSKMQNVTPSDDSVEMTTDHFSTYIIAIKAYNKTSVFSDTYVTVTASQYNWSKVDTIPNKNNNNITIGNKNYNRFYPVEFRVYNNNNSELLGTFGYAYPDTTKNSAKVNFNIYSEKYNIAAVKYNILSSYDKNQVTYTKQKKNNTNSTYENFSLANYINNNNILYVDIYIADNHYLDDVYTVSGATLINYKNYIDPAKLTGTNTNAFRFVESGKTGHNNSNNAYGGDNYDQYNVYQGIASETYGTTFALASSITTSIPLFPTQEQAESDNNYTKAAYDVNIQFKKVDDYYVLDSNSYGYDLIYDDGTPVTDSSAEKTSSNATLKVKSYIEKSGSNNSFFPFETGGDGFHFGMDIPLEFAISSDGLTNGQHTTFEFSGDDDVFVYIDNGLGGEGKLVLDLGGIHQQVTGTIDFNTGTIHYSNPSNNAVQNRASTAQDKKISDSDLYAILGTTREQFAKTTHTLHVVYFERGAGQNNCKIKYNFVPINNTRNYKKNITINKVWDDNNSSARPESLEFHVYGEFTENGSKKYVNLAGQTSTSLIYTSETITASGNWTKTITDVPVFYNDDTSKLITWHADEVIPDNYTLTDYSKTFSSNTSITVDDLIPLPSRDPGSNYYGHFDIEVNATFDTESGNRGIERIKDLNNNENCVTVIGYYEGDASNHTWKAENKSVGMNKHNNYEWRCNNQQPIGENSVIAFYVQYSGSSEYKLVIINKNSIYPEGARYARVANKEFNDTFRDSFSNIAMYYTGSSTSSTGYVDLSGKNLFETALIECPITISNSKGEHHADYKEIYGYDSPGLDFVLSPKTITNISIEGTGHETYTFTNKASTVSLTFEKKLEGTLPATTADGYALNYCYQIKVERVDSNDTTVITKDNSTATTIYPNETTSRAADNIGFSDEDKTFNIWAGQSVTLEGLQPGTYKVTEVGAFKYWKDADQKDHSEQLDLNQFTTTFVDVDSTDDSTRSAQVAIASDSKSVTVENTVKDVFAWELKKVSATTKNPLGGAVFQLSNGTNTYYGKSFYNDSNEQDPNNGLVTWYSDSNFSTVAEIADGEYTLKETKAPPTYAKSNIEYTVNVKKYDGVTVKQGDKTIYQTDENNKTVVVVFENTVAYTLPETGGRGVYVYTIGGVLLMIGAALLLYKTKRNNKNTK